MTLPAIQVGLFHHLPGDSNLAAMAPTRPEKPPHPRLLARPIVQGLQTPDGHTSVSVAVSHHHLQANNALFTNVFAMGILYRLFNAGHPPATAALPAVSAVDSSMAWPAIVSSAFVAR